MKNPYRRSSTPGAASTILAVVAIWAAIGLSSVAAGVAGDLEVDGVIQSTGGGFQFPDGSLQTQGFGQYQNVVVVAESGGDYTSIQAALDDISAAADDHRYLVYVAPGTYSEQVTMLQYVDIVGAGERATKITATAFGALNDGTVVCADDAEIRSLTVENTGGDLFAVGLFCDATSPRISRLTVTASGGTQVNEAIRLLSSTAGLTDVTAEAAGGSIAIGVEMSDSAPSLVRVIAGADSGSVNYGLAHFGELVGEAASLVEVVASGSEGNLNVGLFNNDASPTMVRVRATASGGTDNSAVYNSGDSGPSIRNSILTASGGTGVNYGIRHASVTGSPTTRVDHSQVTSDDATIVGDLNATVLVGASQLAGLAVLPNGGTVTCVAVYDESFMVTGSSCP